MSARSLLALLMVAQAVLAWPAHAQQPAQVQQPAASPDPRAQIVGKIPGTRVEDLRPTPIPGIYELVHGVDIAYVTADAKYAISGDLIDLAANDNLTEQHRREARAKLIGAIPDSDMVIFGPRSPKYTVTVFTDVDCAYCREFHS